jgi:hypothetical protein
MRWNQDPDIWVCGQVSWIPCRNAGRSILRNHYVVLRPHILFYAKCGQVLERCGDFRA